MQVSLSTQAGSPDIPNEDFVAASATTIVVLDGVTPVDRSDTGCRHGVAWYARTVGSHLLAAAGDPGHGLADCLADAIHAARRAHEDTCDLSHPDSPAATVAVVRVDGDVADYLVLADCTLVLDTGADADLGAGLTVVTDNRPADVHRALPQRLPAREYRTGYRNQPAGYWVAAGDPEAADEAFTGSVAGVRRAVATTDGASRLVDQFGQLSWPEALDAIGTSGPAGWIARTRTYECELANSGVAPAKPHDDATVVLLHRGMEAAWKGSR